MAAINTTTTTTTKKLAPASAMPRSKPKGSTTTMASSALPHPIGSSSSNNSNAYQSALETLAPLEPTLAGFARRNKNQHRRARWWASFGMLRRGTSRLLVELVAAAGSRAARRLMTTTTTATSGSALVVTSGGGGSSVAGSKKSKKSSSSGQHEDQHLLDAADQRATWLRDAVAPKCWIQFGQLTADPQFAALGVVLLGSLAQVDSVCCALVGQRPILQEVGSGVQAVAVDGAGTMGFGADVSRGGGDGSTGGLGSGDDLRMVPKADEGRKIARPVASLTDNTTGRVIARTLTVPSRTGGGSITREEAAAARSGSKSKIAGSLLSSGQASPLSLSTPPLTRQDKKPGNQQEESDQEQKSSDSAAHKALKRKRDALRTSIPPMVPTMSSVSTVVGRNKQRQDSNDSSGAIEQDELEVKSSSRVPASNLEPSRQEYATSASSSRVKKPRTEEEGGHTIRIQPDDDPPRKKKSKKIMAVEEDIGDGDKQKKKKKKKKGGGDEFDSLFSSLF